MSAFIFTLCIHSYRVLYWDVAIAVIKCGSCMRSLMISQIPYYVKVLQHNNLAILKNPYLAALFLAIFRKFWHISHLMFTISRRDWNWNISDWRTQFLCLIRSQRDPANPASFTLSITCLTDHHTPYRQNTQACICHDHPSIIQLSSCYCCVYLSSMLSFSKCFDLPPQEFKRWMK